nr:endolytic transglycosylase MltG [Microvirga massiliensis]
MFGRKKLQAPASVEETNGATQFRLAPRSPSEAIKPTAAPPPPPRIRRPRGGFFSALSGFLTFLIAVALAAMIGIALFEREVTAPGPLETDKVVVIPRNTGVSEIAQLLRREGVIEQPLLFEAYAMLNRQRGHLKAGEFLFRAGISMDDAIDTLVQGKSILHAVTVPEGLTSEQIVARLKENDVLTGDIAEIPPEGSLLPDTYKFERGMSRQQLVNSMMASQRQTLAQIWQRRSPDLPIKTPQELVILASIVEKETGRADERTRVAGVFINRLMKRMKLQSDPTIVYGLVGGKGTLGRSILKSEIERPTPFNTYVVEGLPPTPIANPGRAALEAVANPSRTKDLYFVADGTGGHAFAETYEEHVRNVTRWRQIERAKSTGDTENDVDRSQPEVRGDASGLQLPATASALSQTNPAAGRNSGRNNTAGRRNVDASEGTNLDPLLNRTYDLNSAKTVPDLKQP